MQLTVMSPFGLVPLYGVLQVLLLAVSSNGQALDWTAAYAKAEKALANVSLNDKVNIASGQGSRARCIGNTAGIPSIGFPGFCLEGYCVVAKPT
ncbi:hypothetical protein B0H15DRAFT_860028 [Mycena belliarum]|uniref:Uncharacterized protein n=1 Tax=Mycena belliarum TaxID=1033014 RepID=A0AAD6XLI5_9AGAR|nr:hypothetical protein B0H15DRAFT_860028 [Mycena belliae]